MLAQPSLHISHLQNACAIFLDFRFERALHINVFFLINISENQQDPGSEFTKTALAAARMIKGLLSLNVAL